VRLPHHDGRAGCAAVALREGEGPDFKGLAERVRSALPKFAVPLFLRITKTMNLTGNMKHQKNLMRDEGVDPAKVSGDVIFWLKDGVYVEFTEKDWEGLKVGHAKL
jgi:acyl-CoA synthetase (AMP-forming)/AMP-acid ligase II